MSDTYYYSLKYPKSSPGVIRALKSCLGHQPVENWEEMGLDPYLHDRASKLLENILKEEEQMNTVMDTRIKRA